MDQKRNYVCHCFEVKKNDIIRLIRHHKIRKVIEVQSLTRAGTGCGKCKPVIFEILKNEEYIRRKLGDQLLFDFDIDLKNEK